MLNIINYPHPTLRHQSKPLRRVDKRVHEIVAQMFDLMYAHKGVGLAANQVDLPIQLFVINPSGEQDSDQEQVFINPVLQAPKGTAEAEEGCLSIPNVYGNVVRPAQVRVTAYDLKGGQIDQVVEGMLARIVQHEFDHLQGVLFPDRMTESALKGIETELEAFEIEFAAMQNRDHDLNADHVAKRLAELEAEYC